MLADVTAPPGFVAVGMAQGMSHYVEPLMELAEGRDLEDLNGIYQLGMAIWNHAIAVKRDAGSPPEAIIEGISAAFGMDRGESERLFDRMVERKHHLFPADVRPDSPLMMFMRKDSSHLIVEVDHKDMGLSDVLVPPDPADDALMQDLLQLDGLIEREAPYDDYEDLLLDVRDRCEHRFYDWMTVKGAGGHAARLASCLPPYLDFVYGYRHPGIVTLGSITTDDVEEFFLDYLLRKVTVRPQEYADWLPALELFYRFLGEKRYLPDPSLVLKMLTSIRPTFIDTLRNRYS